MYILYLDFNNTNIEPVVLDGGNKTILANWTNDKHIEFYKNNDIPVNISNHPYVLVKKSELCNCETEAVNHFLLESLQHVMNHQKKIIMYFTVSFAFVNYLLNMLIYQLIGQP